MTGPNWTVYRNAARGRWEGLVYVGTTIDGKRRRRKVSGDTRDEVARKVNDLLARRAHGELVVEQGPPPARFPLAPLAAAAPGALVRVSGSTKRRWRLEGLTVWEADRAACRAGVHPGFVWPEWWTVDDDAGQKVAA